MLSETMITRLSQLSQEAALRLRVSSALNPLLWLCGIVTPICLVAGYFFDDGLRTSIVWFGLSPIGLAGLCYVFLMIVEPDRLHSEDYQIRKKALELIEEKGTTIAIEATSVEAIANPSVRALSNKNDEEVE
jgi:hypothetical protein